MRLDLNWKRLSLLRFAMQISIFRPDYNALQCSHFVFEEVKRRTNLRTIRLRFIYDSYYLTRYSRIGHFYCPNIRFHALNEQKKHKEKREMLNRPHRFQVERCSKLHLCLFCFSIWNYVVFFLVDLIFVVLPTCTHDWADSVQFVLICICPKVNCVCQTRQDKTNLAIVNVCCEFGSFHSAHT